MAQRLRSPFAGKPATWLLKDRRGNATFQIEPRILTPFRAMALSYTSDAAIYAAIGYGLWSVAHAENPSVWMWGAALLIPAALEPVIYRVLRWFFRKRVRIQMTQEQFSVQRWFGWRHFDRQLPHRFAVLPHDWVQAERDEEEFRMQQAQMQRQPLKKQRLYADSFHISFDYMGQRNDLMTVYGQKDALRVATRLKACDEALDALARRGHGTPLRPADEWGDQPGAVPEIT